MNIDLTYLPVAILVIAVIYYATRSKKKKKERITRLYDLTFPEFLQHDIRWAFQYINGHHSDFKKLMNHNISDIRFTSVTDPNYPNAIAHLIGRTIQFLKPAPDHIRGYSHRGKRMGTTIVHEVGHAVVGSEHNDEFDDFVRHWCRVLDFPYVEYERH